MNNHFVTYVDIDYKRRIGKSKIRLFKDSIISMKYMIRVTEKYIAMERFMSFLIL